MHLCEPETFPNNWAAALHLDYGADSDHCGQAALEISERGMRFESRWQFSIGTQLAISLEHLHSRLGQCRLTIEGTVVWCEPRPGKRFESTLLFPELPDELRTSLREFSHLVEATV